MAPNTLSAAQEGALFNILTHYQTYAEIQSMQRPATIKNFRFPYSNMNHQKTSAPIIQMVLDKFLAKQPFTSDLPPKFWQEGISGLLLRLAEANQSDSYDKGVIGMRKTLATAMSAVLESLVRGFLEGIFADENKDPKNYRYDLSNAADLKYALDDAVQGLVYGDLIDQLWDQFAQSPRLEDASPLIQALVENIMIFGASLLHHIFVLSPDGKYLYEMMTMFHKLTPYVAVKQVLRVSNAATLMTGMMKLLLTKMSLTAMTNYVGLSHSEYNGQNLLQRIISTVVEFDAHHFKDVASKVKGVNKGPSKEHLKAIKQHVQAPRSEHDRLRDISMIQSKSIVTVIFENADPPLSTSITDFQHAQALEYYAAVLAVHDREELQGLLCRQSPDLFTQAVKDIFEAFDPMIRTLHEKISLSDIITDMEHFMADLIKVTKPKKSGNKGDDLQPPSIEDYVNLFRRHVPALLQVLHKVLKNCPEICNKFRSWAKESMAEFQVSKTGGGLKSSLAMLFEQLPAQEQRPIRQALDVHATYLVSLEKFSTFKLQSILDGRSATLYGPGTFLPRWHGLLDKTLITPADANGRVRQGSDIKYIKGKAKNNWWDTAAIAQSVMKQVPQQPDVSIVVATFGGRFQAMLRDMELDSHPTQAAP
ncbi:hypothetical protein BP6252_13796 [Coleophoma cylindrospora]|uniref:Uncharacterized protein n=1 Tax=Coleophoma cylindrospora TaxID=1849047 RepID=A0A3D8Q739_9HELO|nr:hypothetical protein BP6252_13796 [Coleophoma cylindrospora]